MLSLDTACMTTMMKRSMAYHSSLHWLLDIIRNQRYGRMTLCAIAGYQPPVSYPDILASTSADKGMVKLRTLVIAGLTNTNAELQKDLQQYWRVRDMLSVGASSTWGTEWWYQNCFGKEY